jgi:hypothetical protein
MSSMEHLKTFTNVIYGTSQNVYKCRRSHRIWNISKLLHMSSMEHFKTVTNVFIMFMEHLKTFTHVVYETFQNFYKCIYHVYGTSQNFYTCRLWNILKLLQMQSVA